MQDKPLDRAERDLLAVLLRLDAERGPVSREVLSVEARGRGLEFGRAFARLKGLGLLIEAERRPFFLLRLFGARTTQVLRLTEAGRIAATVAVLPETAAPETVTPETVAIQAVAAVAPVPEMPLAPVTATLSPATEEAIGPEQVAALPLAETPDQSAMPSLKADPETAEAVAAPLVPDVVAEPAGQALPADIPADIPAALTRPKAPVARPRRLPLTAFTEVLGGSPLDEAALPQPAQADPAVVQALRDTLSGLGIDLTMAGEMLIADRLAKGARPAEALSQVVVYAFAHAVRHEISFGHAGPAPGLADYAAEVLRELTRLKDAAEIAPEVHEADMAHLRILTGPAEPREALAEVLLADPFGGAAPPAVLPEELRQGADD